MDLGMTSGKAWGRQRLPAAASISGTCGLAIPDQIISGTVKTLADLGDIKPDAVTTRYFDGSYLPR